MKSQWLLFILASFFLMSCYDHEHIKAEDAEPKYVLNDSSDPVDHFIYDYYKSYGSFILYEYEPVEYLWNISTVLDIDITQQKSRTALQDGLEYLKAILLDKYPDEFKANYFPFKILLADTVTVIKSSVEEKDVLATAGLSFLAVGKIREGAMDIDADSLYQVTGEMQAIFWSEFLYQNEMVEISENFWKASESFYGANLVNVLQEQKHDESLRADDVDVKDYGFWAADDKAMTGARYCMAPDKNLDLYQFIYMITTHTKDEMTALMKGYNKLIDKYNLLVGHLKSVYGVDIQEFGNAKLIK